MTVLEKGNITIHTENIFPIIKKSLYTDHEIFLRELISNSVDAIAKLKMVAYSGEITRELAEPGIEINIDKENRTLCVSDTGIGMTLEEIKKYINQVAFSSAEEFITKYQKDANDLIGHFGLGFYSSFMVAKQVEIDTLSYKDGAEAVHWSCDGSPEFELTASDRTTPGTTITLTLLDDELEYLETPRIQQLIKTYCDFMSVPIKLDGEVINKQRSPWKESTQNLTDEDYLEFYRYLYPFQEEPILWVHLNTDYPFLLNGILYFPKLRGDVDITKGHIKLFSNQVFVSDHCEEIIPEFLMPLRGVIDSPDIPLNVSRSALTNHRTVKRIADFIAKKIGDRLNSVYTENYQAYTNGWQDLGTFVKYGSLKDDKFKKQVEEIIIYRTTYQPEAGEETSNYTTLKAYLDRNQSKHENRVFYCTDLNTQSTYLELYKKQGIEVLFLDTFIDANYFIPFLEQEYQDVKFSRVDAELDKTLLQQDEGGELVDPTSNKTRSEVIKEIFEKAINKPRVNIKTQALKSDDPDSTPPAMILLPEAMRRLQEMSALMQQKTLTFPEDHILVLNTAHPLIDNIYQMSKGSIIQDTGKSSTGELVDLMCQHVYDLAMMAQNAFDAEAVKGFLERSNQVLTRLSK